MHTILWRRLDVPGHEHARVTQEPPYWHLSGAAVFLEDAQAVRLEYLVVCDAQWHTRSGRVKGWIGETAVDLAIAADGDGRWRVNGTEVDEVFGCVDLDLSFSPSTNLLPIRRLDLAIGASGDVRSAWLMLPELKLAPLNQRYTRTGETTYRYESPTLTGDIQVNAVGLVTHYPELWEIEG